MKTNKGVALSLAAVILASGVGTGASAAFAPPAEAKATSTQTNTASQRILADINNVRAKNKLPPLLISSKISTVAQSWSTKMATAQKMESNPNLERSMPQGPGGYSQILGLGNNAGIMVSEWMKNPQNAQAILSKDFTHLGIGFDTDNVPGKGLGYFTLNLGEYPTTNPLKPKALEIYASETSASIDWEYGNDSNLVTDHRVELWQGSKLINTRYTSINSVEYFGLNPNSTYTVKVVARSILPDGAILNSPVQSKNLTMYMMDSDAAPVAAPNPVSSLKATPINDKTARITWNAPTGVIGTISHYELSVKRGHILDRVDYLNADDPRSVLLEDLDAGTAYIIQVQAVVYGNDGVRTAATPMAELKMNTTDARAIASAKAPTNLKASSSYDRVGVSWAAPTGTVGKITSYTVTAKKGSTTVKSVTVTGTAASVTGLTSNTLYILEVKANVTSLDGTNKTSSSVAKINASTTKSPIAKAAAPVLTASKVGYDRVTLNWNKPVVTGTIISYKLKVMQGTKTVKTTSFFGVPAYSKMITGLDEGKNYTATIEVTAMSQDGKNTATARSAAKAFTTSLTAASTVKISTPTVFQNSVNKTGSTLTWKKPAVTGKITSYIVVLKQGTKTLKTYTMNGSTTKLAVTGLKANTAYSYQVKANASSTNGKYKASSAYATVAFKTSK